MIGVVHIVLEKLGIALFDQRQDLVTKKIAIILGIKVGGVIPVGNRLMARELQELGLGHTKKRAKNGAISDWNPQRGLGQT